MKPLLSSSRTMLSSTMSSNFKLAPGFAAQRERIFDLLFSAGASDQRNAVMQLGHGVVGVFQVAAD